MHPRQVVPEKSRIGRYELIKRLAVGGMAEIFLARAKGPMGIDKLVVLKRILHELATSGEYLAMFMDEARIAATLTHPNIVSMFDVGSSEHGFFIVLEHLEGQTLFSLIVSAVEQQQLVPLDVVVHVGIGVAAGLHHAHRRVDEAGQPLSIVHRDVTPQNVFVTYDGDVKLLDFGVAKATNRRNCTRTGIVKGKLSYMSPEQSQGQPLDHRSDVFSLGIMRALCRDLATRYHSAEELRLDLERFARRRPTTKPVRPATPRPAYPETPGHRSLWRVGKRAAVAIAVGAAAFLSLALPTRAPAPRAIGVAAAQPAEASSSEPVPPGSFSPSLPIPTMTFEPTAPPRSRWPAGKRSHHARRPSPGAAQDAEAASSGPPHLEYDFVVF